VSKEEPIDRSTIDRFLKTTGHQFKRQGRNRWLIAFRGEANTFRVLVHVVAPWIVFEVLSYVKRADCEIPQKNPL